MIGKSVKNFFVSLKHFFSPLGAFALGAVLGISVLIPGIISSVKDLYRTVTQVTGSVSADFQGLADSLAQAITALDWSDPSLALNTVFSEEWLTDTLHGCIKSLFPEAEQFAAEITEAV